MKSTVVRREATVCIGEAGLPCGTLGYMRSGARESSDFAHDSRWLASAERFRISPDLDLAEGRQYRKAPTASDSVFHFAIADTEPDGWGRRVIARDHAKRRKAAKAAGEEATVGPLTEWDYLVGVDDASRVGALRLKDGAGNFLRTIEGGERATPPLLELGQLLHASQAVERGSETEADLRYLRGRGTSLGGLRPKCTVVDEDGHLAIGKFPSVTDTRAVTQGEVLALHLARAAGIDAASARIVRCEGSPVAIVRRFDRVAGGLRIPYLSAGSMLLARRDEERAYTEIAARIIATGSRPREDLEELWRRIAYSLLITNVDDHLHNHGFLHEGHDKWRLAPAFDLNPFPDKDQELKTWLSEDTGPVDSVDDLVGIADQFWLSRDQAISILGEVVQAISQWRAIALSPEVGMTLAELEPFEPAFEHAQAVKAARLLGRPAP